MRNPITVLGSSFKMENQQYEHIKKLNIKRMKWPISTARFYSESLSCKLISVSRGNLLLYYHITSKEKNLIASRLAIWGKLKTVQSQLLGTGHKWAGSNNQAFEAFLLNRRFLSSEFDHLEKSFLALVWCRKLLLLFFSCIFSWIGTEL